MTLQAVRSTSRSPNSRSTTRLARDEILAGAVDGIMARHRPTELVELARVIRKTRALLDGLAPGDAEHRICRSTSRRRRCTMLHTHSLPTTRSGHPRHRGRFRAPSGVCPVHDPGTVRMVAFLGGTIGNISPARRPSFLRDVAGLLGRAMSSDGVDLDTDPNEPGAHMTMRPA